MTGDNPLQVVLVNRAVLHPGHALTHRFNDDISFIFTRINIETRENSAGKYE